MFWRTCRRARATTVGAGGFGASYHGQAPILELLGLDKDTRPDDKDESDGPHPCTPVCSSA